MDLARARTSLQAAQLCLEHRLFDSAVNRAYFTMFQAAIAALEEQGNKRREWTHKGVHTDFVHTFIHRRKVVPLSFAKALPTVMQLRHVADYQQPGISRQEAERAVKQARQFLDVIVREVFHVSKTES
jgi:uncharacterized protein (UPF0332 family)